MCYCAYVSVLFISILIILGDYKLSYLRSIDLDLSEKGIFGKESQYRDYLWFL